MIKKIIFDEKGSATVLVAIAMVVFIGFAGMVLDTGNLLLKRQKIQSALDAACLAGAQELPDKVRAKEKAIEYAVLNGLEESAINISFSPDGEKVTASANENISFLFMPVLGIFSSDAGADAAAISVKSLGRAFDYTLFSGSTANTLRISGNSFYVEGTAHANKDIKISGNSMKITGMVDAVGNITVTGNNMEIPHRNPYFEFIEMPDLTEEILLEAQKSGQVYNFGQHFNGNSLNVDGSMYINGDLHLNGNSIRGNGAILATGDIHINGNSINIESGSQVCIYSLKDIKINGNSIKVFGILYAPNGEISFNGNDIEVLGKVIANKLKFSGNSEKVIDNMEEVTCLPKSGSTKPKLVL